MASIALCYPDASFLASPFLSLWDPFLDLLRQVISQGISLILFIHSANIYWSLLCALNYARESDERDGLGTHILVGETDIHFNSIVTGTLETKQTVLREHELRGSMWPGGSGEAFLRK